MRCRQLKKILRSAENREVLRPEEAAHLDSCPDCRQEYELGRRLSAGLRSVPSPQAPAYFSAGVMARIKTAERQEHSAQNLAVLWKRFMIAAAAVLLISGGVLGLLKSVGPQVDLVAEKPPGITQPTVPPAPDATAPGPVISPGTVTPDAKPPSAGTAVNENPPAPAAGTAGGIDQPSTPPKEQPPEGPVAIAAAPRPTYAFLSIQRVLSSTVMRVEVKDLGTAKAQALDVGRFWGASGRTGVDSTSDGQSSIEVLQFVVGPAQAEEFIRALGGLGTLLNRQDEQSDVTNIFNQTKAEYESLVAARNQAPEDARAQIDSQLNAMEKQLMQWDEATGNRTVTLCLVKPF
jgi:hypothetical protein